MDELSPFRYFIQKSKEKESKAKYGEPNISAEYLKDVWAKQKGICPYTKIPMLLLPNSKQCHGKCDAPEKASLDRIDASKGYIKDNVEFVCVVVNLAKRKMSKDVMLKFFDKVAEHRGVTPQSE